MGSGLNYFAIIKRSLRFCYWGFVEKVFVKGICENVIVWKIYRATKSYSPEDHSGANRKHSDGQQGKPVVTIDCGYPVVSVAFGKGKSKKRSSEDNKVSSPYWTRFDFSKLIILATGHTNGRIRLWDGQTGRLLLELMDHTEAVRDLAFAPDGSLRLISGSLDGKLKVFLFCF